MRQYKNFRTRGGLCTDTYLQWLQQAAVTSGAVGVTAAAAARRNQDAHSRLDMY